MKKIETNTGYFSLLEDSLVKVILKENVEIDLENARKNHEATLELAGGKPYAVLVDARVFATMTEEGREYSTKPGMYDDVIAMAVIVKSLAIRLLANFISIVNKRNKGVQTKIFNNEEAAVTWLQKKLGERMNDRGKKSEKLGVLV